MTDQAYEHLLRQYQPLMMKVMCRCRVKKSQPDYEDYVQILRLALFQKSQVRDLSIPNRKTVTLLYNFFLWQVRDTQRRQKRFEALVEKVLQTPPVQQALFETTLELHDQLTRSFPALTFGEQRYLAGSLCYKLSPMEISRYYAVSHTAVLKWRKRLKNRWCALDFF